MKKVIFSVLLIAIVGALVGIGTWAYFSDVETSPGNVFEAGTLDLEVTVDGEPVAVVFDVGDRAPGDWDSVEITMSNVGSLDGSASIHIYVMMDDENFAWEPEIAAGDVEDVADLFDGELAENLILTIMADLEFADPENPVYDKLVAEGSLADAEGKLGGVVFQDILWGVTGVNFFGPDDYSEVFKVNAATGAVEIIAADTGGSLYSDIAVTPNGNLYAVGRDFDGVTGSTANFYDLYRLDPGTGALLRAWVNLFPDEGLRQVNALAAESNTSLLAIEGGGAYNAHLLRINLDGLGNPVTIDDLGAILNIDLQSDGDLAQDPTTGNWYAGFWTGDGSAIYELDLDKPGDSTLVGQSGIEYQAGLAFGRDGTAYQGCWADENLYEGLYPSSVLYNLDAELAGPIFGLAAPMTMPGIESLTFDIGTIKANSSIGLIIKYEVPGWVGNIIQSDICVFDIEFGLVQGVVPLAAKFSFTPAEPAVNEDVHFTNETVGGVVDFSYEWDFGDMATSTEKDPVHAYAYGTAEGFDYTVTLTVTDGEATESIATDTVTVYDYPPEIGMISPEDGEEIIVSVPVTVEASVDDDVGLITWELVGLGHVDPITGDPDPIYGLPDIPAVAYAVNITTAEEFMAYMLTNQSFMFYDDVSGTYKATWETTGLDPGPYMVWVAAVDTIGQFGMCFPPPTVTLIPAPGWWTPVYDEATGKTWWQIPVESVGTTALAQSLYHAEPADGYPPEEEPSESTYELWVSTEVHGSPSYREILIPQASYDSLPSVGYDSTLQWLTLELLMADDGDGVLYLDATGDVDVFSETTSAGTVIDWTNTGPMSPDPAGSALIHLPLMSNVYQQTDTVTYPADGDGPDPLKPEEWGDLIMEVPMDMYMTTAHSANHVDQDPYFLDCKTLEDDGVPFTELGGPAPYVGTTATLVATGAVLDLLALGVFPLDAHFVSVSEILPAP